MRAHIMACLGRFALGVTALLAVLGGFALPGTAHAAVTANRGAALLSAAHTRAGDWYAYGAAGPSAFDCSGLVVWASRQIGISLPHSTYAMLGARRLVRTYHPVAGDLAFYGPGHVEIVDYGHNTTFGAQRTGTRVGDHHWSGWWRPSMYFHLVG